MKNVLIHIGYHKTASTWLQNHLFTSTHPSFEPLSEIDKPTGFSTLAESFIYDNDGYLLNSFDDNEKCIKERLDNIINSKSTLDNRSYFVMSHERLSGNPHSSGFDASVIANRLYNIFPKAKVLIIIREQTSWLVSNYFQYLSIGGTHSIKKYLNLKYDGKRPCFSPNHLKYHLLIDKYYEKFGQQNVLVLPYEMFSENKEAFFKEISDFLNIEVKVDAEIMKIRVNAKKNHFINYRFRFLNYLIRSSSVNNYSFLHNRSFQILGLMIREGLGIITPRFLNKRTRNNIKEYVREWSGSRFSESNIKTDRIIPYELKKYGYL